MRLPGSSDNPEQRIYALIAVAALVVIYLVAFVVSNARAVKVSFVFFSGRASLIWVMLGCLFVGVCLGAVVVRLLPRARGARAGRRRDVEPVAPEATTTRRSDA